MLFALWLSFSFPDTSFARAESLLARGDLRGARAIAERLVAAAHTDSRSHLLLGRVWYAWPVIGRYTALHEFQEAARLDPTNPEPLYWQVRVGQYLKSDEGEGIVRRAILRIFAIDPDYADCWTLFEGLYHNDDIWRRADRALARHPESLVALEHRAQIAIALDEPDRVDALTDGILARRAPYVPVYLLRSEAAFAAGRDGAGYAWYDSAVVYANSDSTGALWDGVWMIASPAEVARAAATEPQARRQFFEWFWGKRDPNLLTPENERIAEHFRRMVEVRRLFHLLHPYASFHHSPAARALAASYARDRFRAAAESATVLDQFSPAHPVLSDLREYNDTTGQSTVYARANLSARGLVWLRHGRPDYWNREAGTWIDVHDWTYYTPEGPLTISFDGIPGAFGAHGDYIVAPPMDRHQARQVRTLLTTDRSSLAATLMARGWSAFFRSETPGFTDFYVRTQPETAAVVLWDTKGAEEQARATGVGLLRVSLRPAAYQMGLDVDSSGAIGRVRETIRVPAYSTAVPGISSLLLAAGDSLLERQGALAGMPADLGFATGTALSSYAELYGLVRDSDGRARYRVRYTFQPVRGLLARLWSRGSPVVFEFDREAEWRGALTERLVIQPGRLAPGRYRVTLSVTDIPSNVKSETVALDIRVR